MTLDILINAFTASLVMSFFDPGRIINDTFLWWLFSCVLVGILAARHMDRNGFLWSGLSLFFSPLAMLMLMGCLGRKSLAL